MESLRASHATELEAGAKSAAALRESLSAAESKLRDGEQSAAALAQVNADLRDRIAALEKELTAAGEAAESARARESAVSSKLAECECLLDAKTVERDKVHFDLVGLQEDHDNLMQDFAFQKKMHDEDKANAAANKQALSAAEERIVALRKALAEREEAAAKVARELDETIRNSSRERESKRKKNSWQLSCPLRVRN